MRYRWITEINERERKAEALRVDQLTLLASAKHAIALGKHLTLSGALLAGVEVVGDLGGAVAQDAMHKSRLAVGRTIGLGLQNVYVGPRQAGAVLGANVALDYRPWSFMTLSADVMGRDTFGTGLALFSSRASLTFSMVPNALGLIPFIYGSAALVIQHVNDMRLSIPGGYRDGVHAALTVRAGVDIDRVRLAFELRTNEGGSGQNLGEITLGCRI